MLPRVKIGKRPDGLTLIPWQGGKPLTWDVTVVSTLADSYLHSTSHSAGSAAETASNRKETKYSSLPPDFITARCYASAVLAIGLCLSVCVCVCLCLSVTSRSSTKTAKRRITQTTPHDSQGTLVFGCQRFPRNSTGITPCGGAKCRWGGSNRRLSTNSWLYLENGTR